MRTGSEAEKYIANPTAYIMDTSRGAGAAAPTGGEMNPFEWLSENRLPPTPPKGSEIAKIRKKEEIKNFRADITYLKTKLLSEYGDNRSSLRKDAIKYANGNKEIIKYWNDLIGQDITTLAENSGESIDDIWRYLGIAIWGQRYRVE